MRVLEYTDLDLSRVRPQYEKVKRQLEADDLRSADLKKLAGADGLYRARLDHANRLIVKLVRHRGERVALALEVVENHAYDRSRFLRGARVDEERTLAVETGELDGTPLPELRYLNPASPRFHLLDKVLSFDEAQEAVFRLPAPLILVGSAGSGKTALALEKLKLASGDVLYLTLSAYLAEHARNLYFAGGYLPEHQNADFLSLRELIETVEVPAGREAGAAEFRGFLARHRQAFRDVADAHALFEEFRGVLTGPDIDTPWLSREAYLGLGVRQSLFAPEQRGRVHDLFEKYLAWVRAEGLYDANVAAQGLLPRMPARYDFAVVDEAQDLTNIQLALALRALRRPGAFLLCGDSNQVVHPNFFSWANVKTLFFEHEELAPRQRIEVLSANYRNAPEVTEAANRLLRVKLARFGAVDRESRYLVQAVGTAKGSVELVADRAAAVKDLDLGTHRSVHVAVIVLRDEDKAEARRSFRTPLLFSVQEAKGLEYETIVLWNVVSRARGDFAEVAAGVTPEDLAAEAGWARPRDKRDKSLERYKFFVNGLYVAMTRAVRRLYLVESDPGHPLLALLGLRERGAATVAAEASTAEEWQAEARRLERQGKQEQAQAIRDGVLHQRAVPWPVLDAAAFAEAARKALDPGCVSSKLRRQVFEYATVYGDYDVLERLSRLGAVDLERGGKEAAAAAGRKHLGPYLAKSPKDALRLVDEYGADHRSPFNQTPLMLAAQAGNVPLARVLVDRGADPDLMDNGGCTALQLALARAVVGRQLPDEAMAALWELLAPTSVSLQVEHRLVKLDAHTIEYLLFQVVYALLRERLTAASWDLGITAAFLKRAADRLPFSALRPDRRRQDYVSAVLARNEADREYAYNRRLFLRLSRGHYALNPDLELRRGEAWTPVYEALGMRRLAALGLRRHAEATSEIDDAHRARRERTARTAETEPVPPPAAPVLAPPRRPEQRSLLDEMEGDGVGRGEASGRAREEG